jgi:hypothetical protein
MARTEIERLRDEAERHAERMEDWSKAYPVDIFPDPPEEKRAKDGVAAQVLRDHACPAFAQDAAMIRRLIAALDSLAPPPDQATQPEEASDGD